MKHYHYIFAGSGLASLMTVYRMVQSGRFEDKSILLLDHVAKQGNDRTWCYWEKGKGNWDAITFRQWETALFAGEKFKAALDFDGYRYKMVRSADFYEHILSVLHKHPNIHFGGQKVLDFIDSGFNVLVKTESQSYTCNKLFNSIYNPALPSAQKKYPVLQQHFIGWHVKTGSPVFDSEKPVFMDFSIPQNGNTRFMYVLPFSDSEAIVEYTLFSKNLLPDAEYEGAIKEYLNNLAVTDYAILSKERGSIPMTCYPFWKHNSKNILNIGTAGGWTKASTGYTFRNADKKSEALVQFLQHNDDLTQFHKKNRFWFYDLLLLDILSRTNHKGSAIFSSMFKSGKAAPIFKFLDEESSFAEDIGVISQCPKGLFIAALIRRIINL